MSNDTQATENASPIQQSNSWWRRLFQFRLRTLLLLTVVAAIYTQWSLRPEPEVSEFGDYKVFHHYVTVSNAPEYGGGESSVHDGAYWITDKQGRLLVRGQFDQGVPIGRWRTYYPNGQLACYGKCDSKSGGRIGVWKLWHRNGQLMQKFTYGKTRPPSESPFQVNRVSVRHGRVSVRHGPAEGRYDDGKLQWRGTFDDDFQHGRWEYFDKEERLIASGEFQHGQRHGMWKIARGETYVDSYYIQGDLTPNPELIDDRELQAWLDSGEEIKRTQAVRIAAHKNRWSLLQKALEQGDFLLRQQVLRAGVQHRDSAGSFLQSARKLEASTIPQLRAAALALRFNAAPSQRELMFAELAELPPDDQRRTAGELVDVDPAVFREAMKSDSIKQSKFAFQCLLCRWAERRNQHNTPSDVFARGPAVRTVLLGADQDQAVPESVRTLVKQWLQDNSSKGMGIGAGGFF